MLLNNLHHGTFILFPSPDQIIRDTKQDHRPRHQRRIIHRRRARRIRRREKTKDPNHNRIPAREGIVGDSERAGDAPGPPDQLRFSRRGVDFAGGMLAGAGEGDGARAAAVEHQDAAHEVGGVEAGDGEGEDVVEDGGGAEVDEGEETG